MTLSWQRKGDGNYAEGRDRRWRIARNLMVSYQLNDGSTGEKYRQAITAPMLDTLPQAKAYVQQREDALAIDLPMSETGWRH